MPNYEKSLLESLEELVFTYDKIVTCKWLSSRLNVHVNTAKQLLCTFSKKDNLLVTYLVSGVLKDGSGHCVHLVSSQKLDTIREAMSVVTSEHVFSIQKQLPNLSINSIYLAETTPDLISPKREPPISPDAHIVRKDLLPLIIDSPLVKTDTVDIPKVSSTQNDQMASRAKPEKTFVSSSSVVNGKFSQQKDKKNIKKNVPVKGSQELGSFFNRQAALVSKMPIQILKERPKESENGAKEEILKKVTETSNTSPEVTKAANGSVKTYGKKKANEKVTRKRKQIDESGKAKKKMKRIVLASDSESSDEASEMEEPPWLEESQEPVTKEETNDEVIPPISKEQHSKKRIRVEVDKVYLEDGFILTKKEYEFKSDDEDSSEMKKIVEDEDKSEKSSKVVKIPSQAKTSPPLTEKSPLKNKQSSIKSFFKKK